MSLLKISDAAKLKLLPDAVQDDTCGRAILLEVAGCNPDGAFLPIPHIYMIAGPVFLYAYRLLRKIDNCLFFSVPASVDGLGATCACRLHGKSCRDAARYDPVHLNNNCISSGNCSTETSAGLPAFYGLSFTGITRDFPCLQCVGLGIPSMSCLKQYLLCLALQPLASFQHQK